MITKDQLRFVPLDTDSPVFSFECGNADLNHFLLDEAADYQKDKLAVTYLCYFGPELVGFVTVATDALRLDDSEKENFPENKARLHEYPSMKVARLAVHSNWQRKGVGTLLVRGALGLLVQWSALFGCRFATLDAKPDALGFYEKHDFLKNLHKQEKSRHTISMRYDLLHYES